MHVSHSRVTRFNPPSLAPSASRKCTSQWRALMAQGCGFLTPISKTCMVFWLQNLPLSVLVFVGFRDSEPEDGRALPPQIEENQYRK